MTTEKERPKSINEIKKEIKKIENSEDYDEEDFDMCFDNISDYKRLIELQATLKTREEDLEMIEGKLGVTEINNNLHKSFKGTFRSAMKNGYSLDEHYVIVDWVYFHELLELERELKQKLQGEKA